MASAPLTNDPCYQRACELLATVADLQATASMLQWDQRVNLSEGAVAERAAQLATVSRLRHEIFTGDELGDLLDVLHARVDEQGLGDAASLVRVARREYRRAARLPSEYVARRTEATSRAQAAWERARANSSFAGLRRDLQQVVELMVEEAERLGYAQERYDALLDTFEPDTSTATVRRLLAQLREAIMPWVEAAAERRPGEAAWQQHSYSARMQRQFGQRLLRSIGYDLALGRMDRSAHPFCVALSPHDVRLTTRVEDQGLGGLWATLHEGGHGIHAQGIPARYHRTPLWGSPGLGISESQSRLFENVVGRSRPFWSHHYPALQESFPQALADVSPDAFYRGINRIRPSVIRVSADEVTYHLHIMVRFELEVALVEERLAVAELPAAWNARMEEYLGLTPASDAEGVLQDIHWSAGAFGYFPTYSLGSLLASLWWEEAVAAAPAVESDLAQGHCDTLRQWLTEHVYSYGAKLTPPSLVQHVTGAGITTEPFLRHLDDKYGPLV